MRARKSLVVLCGLIGLAATAGCASMQEYSAGLVGCKPEEVVITNDKGFGLSRIWQVDCQGRTFMCSGAGEEQDRCKEVVDPAAAEPAKPEETSKPTDTQPEPAGTKLEDAPADAPAPAAEPAAEPPAPIDHK